MYLQPFPSGDVGLVIGGLRRGYFYKTMGAGKTIHKIQKEKNTDFSIMFFLCVRKRSKTFC